MVIESYPGGRTVKDAIQIDIKGDLDELWALVAAGIAGSGVLVSSNDTSVGFLNGKLVAGGGISLTEGNDGGDETLTVASSGAGSTCADEATLGTGATAGEIKVTRDTGNIWVWDGTNSKWMVTPGTIHAAEPSATTYTIITNTVVTVAGELKKYNGTRWTFEATAGTAVGAILTMAIGTVPSGYLECDGAAVSRTAYPELFTVISTNYGVGDGSTTFNVPDFRGQFLRGWDHGATIDPDSASRTDRGDGTTGDYVGTKQAGENESHGHSTVAAGGHSHTITVRPSAGTIGIDGAAGAGTTTTKGTTHEPSHSHGVGSAGGSESRPINTNVLYCIFTG